MGFPPLESNLTPDRLEQQILGLWKAEGLFQQTLDATRYGPPFVFYEGPPTANGRPGIHHVFSRTIKDLVNRYQTMLGRWVLRIAGWDTHGLPVEIEVEKQLGVHDKRDIEERVGIAEFNRRCRESVWQYKQEWEQLSDRIGYWLDYDRPYVTYTSPYIETVWWLLERLHARGLLVKGHKVLPYCPRCGTALSSHELALGYRDVQTNSAYVTFRVTEGRPGAELVVWTTTPWTLLSNVAVAVHPEMEYGVWEVDGRQLIAATARADDIRVNGKPLSEARRAATLPGSALAGWRYARPLSAVALPEQGRRELVVPADFVTADEGSGIVHLAPAFGADDYQAGQEHDLTLVNPVGADGTFQGLNWPELDGKPVTAKATNEVIIRRLKVDGRWLDTRPHQHTYPHCWRCDEPLIYYARTSWFLRTTAIRDRLLALNEEVEWHPPEVGRGRFGEWLANNVDWALSRDRYWGTPLPVWICDADDQHVEVVGSFAELASRWGRPLPEGFDPHKPGIDEYTWGCGRCGGRMRRTPEVIDAWFDSGAMPFAQWHYPFEHEAEFAQQFPADFICEGIDQTRGWFYSLLAIAAAAFDRAPYRHVIVNELVLDAQGQKMSKSRGNVVNPWQVVEEHGADAVRLYLLASSQVWLPKRFDRSAIHEVVGAFLEKLRHTYGFLQLYAEDWTAEHAPPVAERPLVDRWLLGRLDRMVAAVRRAWSGFDATAGVRAIMEFTIDDLSNWYVRVNRARFWAPDRAADPAALATLHEALTGVVGCLAPAAPFLADWLHRALTGTSVHLATFPSDRGREDESLSRAMDAVRRLVTLARAARQGHFRVRQPLSRMRIAVPEQVRGPQFAELIDLLQSEVNVKEIVVVQSDAELVRLHGRANFRSLGARYGRRTPLAARAVERLEAASLRRLEEGREVEVTFEGESFTLLPDDVTVAREVVTDWLVQSDGPFVAALDPTVSDELRLEGLARELVNRVQQLRKDAGYEYVTRIEIGLVGDPMLERAASEFEPYLAGETLARRVVVGERLADPDREQQVDIDGYLATIAIRRADRQP